MSEEQKADPFTRRKTLPQLVSMVSHKYTGRTEHKVDSTSPSVNMYSRYSRVEAQKTSRQSLTGVKKSKLPVLTFEPEFNSLDTCSFYF